jgi:hypothetical protein
MKRKGISKQTIARYLAAFIEIKAAIDANPKCQTSQICRQFKIGQHPVTMLKKTGVIVQKNGRKKWVGNEPNVEMVVQIAEAIHNYHAELRSRGLKGEMFDRKNKAVEMTNAIKPMVTELEAWKHRYIKQEAVKTNISIQSEVYDQSMISEFIQHNGEIESSKPIKKRFQVKIFGIKLFSFNY